VTVHRKRPANQKSGKAAPNRPTRAERAASVAPAAGGTSDQPLGLDLAVELDAAGIEEFVAVAEPVAVPAPDRRRYPPATAPNRASSRPQQAAAVAAPALSGYGSVVATAEPQRGVLPARTRGRTAPKVYALSREQEYAYIREDMRRLLIIAAILLVLMIALLFMIER
jgi:hypothetical protein